MELSVPLNRLEVVCKYAEKQEQMYFSEKHVHLQL